MEYLVYRVYLVDISNQVGSNKFFIREFGTQMKIAEKETFIENFKRIFTTNLPQIRIDLNSVTNQPVKDFLRDKNIVKGFDTSNIDRVAALIYGLRCSIVHNKESGYHLTLATEEEYRIIIPLIRQTLKTMEYLVIQKIADNDLTIKYPRREMNLY